MSRIFKLKKWLTLADGARYLTAALNEPISVSDIYQLALDGHLILSAHFVNHTQAYPGRRIGLGEAKIMLLPDAQAPLAEELKALMGSYPTEGSRSEQHEWLSANRAVSDSPSVHLCLKGDRISEHDVIDWEDRVVSIDGLWDIPDFGGGRLDLEHQLQSLVGGPEITLTCLDGTVVISPDGARFAKLLDRFDTDSAGEKYSYGDPRSYYPRAGLPEDAPVVIRSESITSFLDALAVGSDVKKDVTTRERGGLLRIIAGLAKEARVDLNSPSAATQIVAAADPFGGPDEKTVRKHLKTIREEILPGRGR